MIMPFGHKDYVVGFDRQLGTVNECQSFSADDIKEFIGLAMDVHTRRCPWGHRVPKHLGALCASSRTRLDECWSSAWQTLALTRFQHSAALLRPHRANADEDEDEQNENPLVNDHFQNPDVDARASTGPGRMLDVTASPDVCTATTPLAIGRHASRTPSCS